MTFWYDVLQSISLCLAFEISPESFNSPVAEFNVWLFFHFGQRWANKIQRIKNWYFLKRLVSKSRNI